MGWLADYMDAKAIDVDMTPEGSMEENVWMPAQVEETPAWRVRLREELAGVNDKLTKLGAFMQTPAFAALDEAERNDLTEQSGHMAQYGRCLFRRLARAMKADLAKMAK